MARHPNPRNGSSNVGRGRISRGYSTPGCTSNHTRSTPGFTSNHTSSTREAAAGRPKELLKRKVDEGGLRSSHSNLSCRFSRACSRLDRFFKHCGPKPEVIENLAREKFAATATFESLALTFRSVSCPDSESEQSRHSSSDSGNEPLQGKNKPPARSVIERNARVIQWLYSCKRAKEPKGKAPSVLV